MVMNESLEERIKKEVMEELNIHRSISPVGKSVVEYERELGIRNSYEDKIDKLISLAIHKTSSEIFRRIEEKAFQRYDGVTGECWFEIKSDDYEAIKKEFLKR